MLATGWLGTQLGRKEHKDWGWRASHGKKRVGQGWGLKAMEGTGGVVGPLSENM